MARRPGLLPRVRPACYCSDQWTVPVLQILSGNCDCEDLGPTDSRHCMSSWIITATNIVAIWKILINRRWMSWWKSFAVDVLVKFRETVNLRSAKRFPRVIFEIWLCTNRTDTAQSSFENMLLWPETKFWNNFVINKITLKLLRLSVWNVWQIVDCLEDECCVTYKGL